MAQSIIYKGQKYVRVDSVRPRTRRGVRVDTEYLNNKIFNKLTQIVKDITTGNSITFSNIKVQQVSDTITIDCVIGFKKDEWQTQLNALKRDFKNFKSISGLKVLKSSISRFNKDMFSRLHITLGVDMAKLPTNFKGRKEYSEEVLIKAARDLAQKGVYERMLNEDFRERYGTSERRRDYISTNNVDYIKCDDKTLQSGYVTIGFSGKKMNVYDDDGDYYKIDQTEAYIRVPAKDLLYYAERV